MWWLAEGKGGDGKRKRAKGVQYMVTYPEQTNLQLRSMAISEELEVRDMYKSFIGEMNNAG